MNRVLVIDKPRGFTSHDVVARVRRMTRTQKVGHAGTLDPAATGVLVVLLGKATRLAQFFVDLDKSYRGRVVLGVTTNTQDAEGDVESTGDVSGVTRAQIEDAFAAFEGETEQIPPMVSALKRDGTPLYVLARRGEVVERAPRPITINELRVLSVEMPEVEFEMTCSRGTYVRTVAADIGARLGCGGHLGQLVRTAVGPFHVDGATTLDELAGALASTEGAGYSMYDALSFMPEVRVTEREEEALSTGGAIDIDTGRLDDPAGSFFRLSADGAELVAVGKTIDTPAGSGAGAVAPGKIRIQPVRVFVEPI
ncbi:MAG: tRNA pseudouridine(55) synthase TruB [Candidatus Eisenbacteria sp.]|nr:tRNA pseudouridine(55) synthase TruB [Candidatus Eisenbacteria bacterium]